jgi:hypothetical protein
VWVWSAHDKVEIPTSGMGQGLIVSFCEDRRALTVLVHQPPSKDVSAGGPPLDACVRVCDHWVTIERTLIRISKFLALVPFCATPTPTRDEWHVYIWAHPWGNIPSHK